MINDDIEFLPQDSFFICMGDDGKPVYGVVSPHDHYNEFRAIIEYKGKRWMAQSNDSLHAALLVKEKFLATHPELAKSEDILKQLSLDLARVMYRLHLDKVPLTYLYDANPFAPRPVDQDARFAIFKIKPIEIKIVATTERALGESHFRSSAVEMVAYQDNDTNGLSFYSKVL